MEGEQQVEEDGFFRPVFPSRVEEDGFFRPVFPSRGFWAAVHWNSSNTYQAHHVRGLITSASLSSSPLAPPLRWSSWAQISRPAHCKRSDTQRRRDKGLSLVTRPESPGNRNFKCLSCIMNRECLKFIEFLLFTVMGRPQHLTLPSYKCMCVTPIDQA